MEPIGYLPQYGRLFTFTHTLIIFGSSSIAPHWYAHLIGVPKETLMRKTRLCAYFFALTAVTAASVQAQATRTWVSGVGDDANPCSRTAPCKTFAGAISKTAASGEINCIDPGGFGALTITKAITIDCTGVEAGVLVSGTNGFVVAAATTDVV